MERLNLNEVLYLEMVFLTCLNLNYRPLIPPKHQTDYDKLAPAPPGRKLRAITLRKRPNESFGCAVRGGMTTQIID